MHNIWNRPLIWQSLLSGAPTQDVLMLLQSRFEATTEVIENELYDFVNKLAISGCLSPVDERKSTPRAAASLQQSPEKREPWKSPELAISTDKNEALMRVTRISGWQPAAPRIVAESIDEEVIAVDLMAGIYHSITGAGVVVWDGLTRGLVGDELVQLLCTHFEVSEKAASAEVDDVIAKFVEFDLIFPRKEKVENKGDDKTEPAKAIKEPFERTSIIVYRDMEDVLRLDPVHDVDEHGWPSRV